MPRFVSILLILLSLAPTPTMAALRMPAAAQVADGSLEAAAEFARELSRLESAADWQTLALLMHPDSARLVPAEAVAGWFGEAFADRVAGEIEVIDVRAEPWTWPVSGETYHGSVTVQYVQPFWVAGERVDVPGEVHVVHDGERWGWFFGASPEFVSAQIARFSGVAPAIGGPSLTDASLAVSAARFQDPVLARVDAFWQAEFDAAGRAYEPPSGVVPFDAPLQTACGLADPGVETAFYCVLDRTIYYSTGFRENVETGVGDFGWVAVVAHEWAHHVQLLLGYDLGIMSYRSTVGAHPPIALEQQADCLAGAFTDAAEFVGWVGPGDVDEAKIMTEISGDPEGSDAAGAFAHGTGEERAAAFASGYDAGIDACGLGL